MVTKIFKAKVKSVDEENFTVDVIMNDETPDRYEESILTSAWNLKNYKNHPILLSSHNYHSLKAQIGEATKIKANKKEKRLEATFKYYVGQGNEEADWGFFLSKKGIAAFSVGFIPLDWETADWEKYEESLKAGKPIPWRTYTKVELLENSQVVVPAHPNALQNALKSKDDLLRDIATEMKTLESVEKVKNCEGCGDCECEKDGEKEVIENESTITRLTDEELTQFKDNWEKENKEEAEPVDPVETTKTREEVDLVDPVDSVESGEGEEMPESIPFLGDDSVKKALKVMIKDGVKEMIHEEIKTVAKELADTLYEELINKFGFVEAEVEEPTETIEPVLEEKGLSKVLEKLQGKDYVSQALSLLNKNSEKLSGE